MIDNKDYPKNIDMIKKSKFKKEWKKQLKFKIID